METNEKLIAVVEIGGDKATQFWARADDLAQAYNEKSTDIVYSVKSLKKLPAEKVKTKRQVPPENWQVLYGQYKENLRLCFLPVNEETNQGYWFGFESEIQKPEPVFKAMN